MNSSHEQIIEYSPDWAEAYEGEAEKLKPVFGESLVAVEHIGSTSVPGLVGKPIVDIGVLIKNHEEADNFVEPFAALGYKFDRDLHEKTEFPERHFFRKGEPTQFHLSIAYADKAKFWSRQILFRDYLRSHPEDRDRYGALKKKLLEADPTGVASYISGKTEFIQEILNKAGFN
jgi:GrpB-like predicted nucleotidyltransferase (UPF0157 family)